MEQEERRSTKIKRFLYRAFESRDYSDKLSLAFDIIYIVVILAAVSFSIIEVVAPELWEQHRIFTIAEYITVGLFAFEWFSMLYISDIVFPATSRFKSALKWIISLESIVDIICLIVFIASFIPTEGVPNEVEILLRLVALIKLIRLYKWAKYLRFLKKEKKENKEMGEVKDDSNQ